jgi:predicted metalloprotease with PDZ domain
MRYRLSTPEPQTHLLHVELALDHPGEAFELAMPVWTPGSYLVREYARHVEGLSALDGEGRPLTWERLDKHRVQVRSAGAARAVVRWRVYANDLTVRTSHLDATHATVNGAGVFFAVRGREREPVELSVEAPQGWRVTTALEGGPREFRAAGFDELVDAPLELGTHEVVAFEAMGARHELAAWGRGDLDLPRLAADARRIVEAFGALMGELPYRRYLFLLQLTGQGRGGLEHAGSTVIQLPRAALADPEGWEEVLGLLAHEYFHVWNVKGLRPRALLPYDYGREQYTRLLWWFEGLTCYLEGLTLTRAGLTPPGRYLRRLGRLFTSLWRTPGAGKLPVEEASLLAWVKLYRPDENSGNSGVSYYLKGELVALALDLELRRAGRSIDELFRLAWQRHAADGLPEDGPERLVAELLGQEAARTFFDRYVRGVEPLEPALSLVGLALRRRAAEGVDDKGGAPGKGSEDGRTPGWLGAELAAGPRLAVRSVREGGPAWWAGLCAEDELVADRGFRLDRAGLEKRLQALGPGGLLRLHLFRRDELLQLTVPLGSPPEDTAWLEPDPAATPQARAAFQAWCGQPWPGR